MLYNKPPLPIANIEINVSEFFKYLYLPIKLGDSAVISIEPRLDPICPIIGRACSDFVGKNGLDEFVQSYIYVTAKNEYQQKGQSFNRPGWHSDGFGTNDISYIWSNKQPTIFNGSNFDLCDDDTASMAQMEEQADERFNFTLPNNSLIRMDQFTIHRVGEPEEGVRCFVKIVFSRDQYKLIGNSVNYNLPYKWEYSPRRPERNIPQGKLNVR
mgnify:CR=1 FL=1